MIWKYNIQSRGFTLIEMMISLVLVGAIMLLIFSGLRMGARSWDASEVVFESFSDMRSVLLFVKRSVSNAYPLRLNQAADNALVFEGDQGSLQLVTELANMRGMGGYYVISMDIEKSRLRIRIAPYTVKIDHMDDIEYLDTHLLSNNVNRLRISYFGKKKSSEKARWHDVWKKQSQFPQLVKINVSLQSANWPELIVQPHIASDAACLWDNWHQRCIR